MSTTSGMTDGEMLDLFQKGQAMLEIPREMADHDAWVQQDVAGARAVAAAAWDEAVGSIRSEIRAIPCWVASETEHGFDLQPLGPNRTSEEGARVAVFGALGAVTNPYANALVTDERTEK